MNEERALDGIGDEQLLGLAAGEGRVLVTFDVRDFHRLATEWAVAGRSHAGCAILVGIDHSEFNLIIRRLEELFLDRSDPRSWRDLVCFVTRSR